VIDAANGSSHLVLVHGKVRHEFVCLLQMEVGCCVES
jgi:hypothetical protein